VWVSQLGTDLSRSALASQTGRSDVSRPVRRKGFARMGRRSATKVLAADARMAARHAGIAAVVKHQMPCLPAGFGTQSTLRSAA